MHQIRFVELDLGGGLLLREREGKGRGGREGKKGDCLPHSEILNTPLFV